MVRRIPMSLLGNEGGGDDTVPVGDTTWLGRSAHVQDL
jgi:hypothetical protein